MSGVLQPSFSAGELSPGLSGRIDLARYQTGLKTCRNFIVQAYGGVVNRPGTVFVCEASSHERPDFLLPFRWGEGQNYVLALGEKTMRVIQRGALVVDGSDKIVQVATPWSAADTFDLHYAQSGDVVTVVHPKYPPYQIKRYAHGDWRIEKYAPEHGPFEDVNVDVEKTMTATGRVGSIEFSTNFDCFDASDVGRMIYFEIQDYQDYKAWQSNVETSKGDVVVSNSKIYQAVELSGSKTRTGSTAPDHDEGCAWDGSGRVEDNGFSYGVKWQYWAGPIGYATIIEVIDKRRVKAKVDAKRPIAKRSGSSGEACTYKWALSSWCEKNGYPSAVGYFQQRMVFAGSTAYPQTVWMTVTGSYTDFATELPALDSDAITLVLASSQVNPVRHVLSLRSLLLMTSSSEWSITNVDEAVTAETVNTQVQSYRGSANLPPLNVGNMALVVQSKGQIVRDLGYEWASDSFSGNDLCVMADHLFAGHRLVDWDFAQAPFSVAWCVREDGVLLGLTYMREHEVFAWHRHDTQGKFESVCVIEEAEEDRVYVTVAREVGGQTRRYIEYFAKREAVGLSDGIFLDSSLSYVGEPVAKFSGLNHLEGKTVGVLADGSVMPDTVVKGGAIELRNPAKVVRVGLRYESDLETLRLSAPDGNLFGKHTIVRSVRLLCRDTRGLWIGNEWDRLAEIKQRSNEPYGDPIALRTGWFDVGVGATWTREAHLCIRQKDPLPATVLAVMPEVEATR